MNKDKQAAGVPICDDELEVVGGGMRVYGGLATCPVCGGTNTPFKNGNKNYRICYSAGCGTIFESNSGKVVGVDPTIANKK